VRWGGPLYSTQWHRNDTHIPFPPPCVLALCQNVDEGACIETSDRVLDPNPDPESDPRFSHFDDAEADCSDENGRLPSVQELQTFPYPSGAPYDAEWTSQRDHDGSYVEYLEGNPEFWAVVFYGYDSNNVSFLRHPENERALYRCVVPPS
jgi:hypothetical protein